ncbi:MAG: hypothetical protein JWP87_1152 [Labilithrix sp.]|nr:hypothetical protein [Labilithrix sp.]
MAKFQSPLLGYNNNVRHKNRVFHIQTEDSGVNHPHIITHLFMDGGRILKSVKKSYAEHVGADGMNETVRGLMKEQHKAMFIALRDGQFDYLVEGGAPPAASATTAAAAPVAAASEAAVPVAAPVAAPVASPAPPRAASVPPAAGAIVQAIEPIVVATFVAAGDVLAASMAPPSGPPTSPDPPRSDTEAAPNTIDESRRASNAANASVAPPRIVLPPNDAEDAPMTTRQPADGRPDAAAASAKSPSDRELTLDFDALERAAQDRASPSLFHSSDLPPPPKNLFAAKEPGTGGAYRAVEADPRHDAREEAGGRSADPREENARSAARHGAPPPSTRGEKPAPVVPPSGRAPASRPVEGRYAPARPAAIFGSTQRPQPQSLFNDELVSDKSLDEVILSYLAEDLEPPRRK